MHLPPLKGFYSFKRCYKKHTLSFCSYLYRRHHNFVEIKIEQNVNPRRGYFHIRRSGEGEGRLGPHIKFGGKIWGKVQPNSPNKRKNLGSSVTIIRHKSLGKIPILGSYLKFRGQNLGYLSPIFLEANFGAEPADLLIWKYRLGCKQTLKYSLNEYAAPLTECLLFLAIS